MKSPHWHDLSRFESHDLVKAWHKKTHGKDPSTAKVSQINALFIQGREYFRNSALAEMSVKPLLLYYGVLSLSRGAILLKTPSKKEESLEPRHGLEIVGWQETFKEGIKSVLDLKIRATSGTFRELVEACENKHNEECFYYPTKTNTVIHHDLGNIRFATDSSLLSLHDLLSRLMQTTTQYQGITGVKSKWFPTIVTSYQNETHFALISPHVLPELKALIDGEYVFLKPTLKSWPNPTVGSIHQFSLVFLHKAGKAHQEKFPVFHYTKGHQFMYGILDFPNKDKLSEFFKLYLTSYLLGMLARYYPSMWMALLRNSPGDFAQPLIAKAVEAIDTDFPGELNKQVPQHPTTLN